MISDEERRRESLRVSEVVGRIGGRLEKLKRDAAESKTEVVDIRKHFWSDITVNIERGDDRMETEAGIRQQTALLTERERTLAFAQETIGKLERLRQSPYFGRVDFAERGEAAAERLYIGLASFLDDKTQLYLVYDWRAPISSLYYDHAPGPAAYATPSGTVSGTMELKRQFVIKQGKLELMFDTGVAIGDEMLQQALGSSADTHMRSIVATIQQEQNAIIRDDRGKLLVVQGAAGSGKTSVALQRAAYLLYKHRESLRADQMVLFSPNGLFNSYVSTVLPELGEANIEQTTLQDYLAFRLDGLLQLEHPYTQLEYALTARELPGYDARMAGIRHKASADFYETLERYCALLEQRGMRFRDIVFRGRVLIPGERLAAQFYAMDGAIRLHNRIEALQEWLLAELATLAKAERKRKWVEAAIELLDKEDYARAVAQLRKKRPAADELFDDFQQERALLARAVVSKRFKPLRAGVKRKTFVDVPALYAQLFADPELFAATNGGRPLPANWDAICRQTLLRLEAGELAYEDATPLLVIRELVEGFQTYTHIKYVMVDEGQDYSPLQYRYLKRLFPRAKLTVLGDWNQAIMPHRTALLGEAGRMQGAASMQALFGETNAIAYRLGKTYRSTQEIVAFASRILPDGSAIEPFRRSGDRPTIAVADCREQLAALIVAEIAALQARGVVSIAVVCKTAAETELACELLQPHVPLARVTKETSAFAPGTQAMPVYLAKGVEFDAVLLFDCSQAVYGRESDRNLLYTACTRAMHHLRVFSLGAPSVFLDHGVRPSDL
ncbi:MAG: UvrD-helicase domain-containing protein [Paenibacillaceae bacterium]|nr:UvrD-helicase domain-containing protein [Paenibacillaceae bacterium]